MARRLKKSPRKNSSRKSSTSKRAARVYRDMLRNASLSFAKAARQQKIDRRTVLHHFGSDFQKDASGRIRPRPKGRSKQTLYIPTSDPGREQPISTKNASERRLVGRWMAGVNAAGRGHFSKIDKFPRSKSIGGVALPTNRKDIQRILKALADKESSFENLYCTLRRPS